MTICSILRDTSHVSGDFVSMIIELVIDSFTLIYLQRAVKMGLDSR